MINITRRNNVKNRSVYLIAWEVKCDNTCDSAFVGGEPRGYV